MSRIENIKNHLLKEDLLPLSQLKNNKRRGVKNTPIRTGINSIDQEKINGLSGDTWNMYKSEIIENEINWNHGLFLKK